MYLEMLCHVCVTSCISLIIKKTLQVHGKCAPMLVGGDPDSHTPPKLGLKQDSRESSAECSRWHHQGC